MTQFSRCHPRTAADQTLSRVHRTPAPADTAGLLWTITALPHTSNDTRLCTLSCQNAETLALFKAGEAHPDPCGFVNVKRPEGGRLPLWPKRLRHTYKALRNSTTLVFDDMGEAFRLLHQPRTLDCCYQANAELMRRGASMYQQYNNPYLVEDILAGL